MNDVQSIGLLIFGALLGAFICAKARSAGGAVVFALIAAVLILSTPAGSGLPGAISRVLSTVNESTTPALTHNGGAAPAEVGHDGGGKR